MTLEGALQAFARTGYCLWVGAGIARGFGGRVPLWGELVEKLEDAHVIKKDPHAPFPLRLQRVHEAVGWEQFAKLLRASILVPSAKELTDLAESLKDATGPEIIPLHARRLARLAHVANPIVSFNIEALTSWLLAAPNPPVDIRCFEPPLFHKSDLAKGNDGQRPEGDKQTFRRPVYHPHGHLQHGLCVLTKQDYESLDPTLAFQVAIHSAFKQPLVIVGMSLEDDYLRAQIEKFRRWIDGVFWFTSPGELSRERQEWVKTSEIHVHDVGDRWERFWAAVDTLPAPREVDQVMAWKHVIQRANGVLQGASGIEHTIRFLEEQGADKAVPAWRHLQKTLGEPPSPGAPVHPTPTPGYSAVLKYLASLMSR